MYYSLSQPVYLDSHIHIQMYYTNIHRQLSTYTTDTKRKFLHTSQYDKHFAETKFSEDLLRNNNIHVNLTIIINHSNTKILKRGKTAKIYDKNVIKDIL